MAFALIMGVLFKSPEAKQSSNGKRYVTATIKCREGDGRATFWRLSVFNQAAQDELLRLRENDALSAQGVMKAEVYAPADGDARVSLSMVADGILPAKPQKKDKVATSKPFTSTSKVVPLRRSDKPVIHDDLNDECPF